MKRKLTSLNKDVLSKVCSQCGTRKVLEAFIDRSSVTGVRDSCKPCNAKLLKVV